MSPPSLILNPNVHYNKSNNNNTERKKKQKHLPILLYEIPIPAIRAGHIFILFRG